MKKILPLFVFIFGLAQFTPGYAQFIIQKANENPVQEPGGSRFSVTATVMDNDTWCLVEWPDPIGNPWEMTYDDGDADDFFVWANPGCLSANKFSPLGYPILVTGGKLYVGDGSFPGPFLGVTFRVLVYDDDGDNGLPGTALDSIDVTVMNYGWVEFEGMTAEITEGDFYLAIRQLTAPPDAAPVGVDTDNPTYSISYANFNGEWLLSPLQDFMIRAWVTYYDEPGRAVDSFEVSRFSGFEPDESPLLGDINALDTIFQSEFSDYAWDSLELGLYAYGIRTIFSGGEWSDYDVSNLVSKRGDGYPLPFLEQWNDGNFETNNWTAESDNWSINWQQGQASPSAEFTWDPIQSEYAIALESHPLLADSLSVGNIYLDYDIRLESVNPTGNELVLAQVWDWISQDWSTVASNSNVDGSFDWMAQHIDISEQAMGNVFKIRFLATGENSLDILGWYVDNIHVYRACNPPRNLVVAWHWPNYDFNLSWQAPLGATLENYIIQWDDGVFSGNSIGTGDEVEFDAAARWTPEYLSNYSNCELTEVSFIPNEHQAVYRIRVWSGENAENLIIDQEVQSPIIGDWNVIPLDSIIDVNINEELWVGYNVNTPAGYPAGVDNGPAVNGYGNMMNFGGWQTLLEINPDLDYNWNIKATIKSKTINDTISRYAIYRSDEWQEYFFRGYAENEYYHDDSAICGSTRMHCYKIKAIYENEIDFCESDFSDLVCEPCEKIREQQIETGVKIYPNPAQDVLNIESAEKIESITIFNGRGEVVKGGQGDGVTRRINLTGLAPGLYLVRVVTESGIVTRKVVVGR